MFVVMNRLRCPADYAEHLERAFGHAGNLEGVRGFTAFQFLKREDEGDFREYIALTQWEDRAAYESWTKSEAFTHAHQSSGHGASPVTAVVESYEVLK